jgi:hypothetical protein
MQDREIKVILEHPLDGPGLGLLRRAQPLVEIEAVRLLDMRADERGIADAVRTGFDEGDLALRRLGRRGALEPVGNARHFEVNLALHHERAGVGQAECRPESVENQHVAPPNAGRLVLSKDC